MRSTLCQVWSSGGRQQHCEVLSLKGAAVMTCPLCVASSGAELCCWDAAFRLGPQVPPLLGSRDHKLPVTLVTLEDWDRTGPLTGLVEGKDIVGSPIARWTPWHPPPCRPAIPCGSRMIICMTEPGAFAASDYDSPWQQAFFSSLSHAPDNFMTGCPAQLQERVCGCIS